MDYLEFKQREDLKQAKQHYKASMKSITIYNNAFKHGFAQGTLHYSIQSITLAVLGFTSIYCWLT